MTRLVSLLSVITFCVVLSGCNSLQTSVHENAHDSGFVHVVFFWMEENTDDYDRDALIRDCYALLGGIETVTHIEAGEPAGTPRDVVDNSYGVALLVEFANSAGHDVYQTHELHTRFIERNQHRWSRVQVYDFVPGQ